MPASQKGGNVEFYIGLASVINTDDEPVTVTGVELVGEGEFSVVEAAIMPSYDDDYLHRTNIGGILMPAPPSIDLSKWEETRQTVPAAGIEAGEIVDIAYRAKATPPAYVDYAEWIHQDQSGTEYILADPVSVAVDKADTGCAAR